jgi:hypothetical protein
VSSWSRLNRSDVDAMVLLLTIRTAGSPATSNGNLQPSGGEVPGPNERFDHPLTSEYSRSRLGRAIASFAELLVRRVEAVPGHRAISMRLPQHD